MEYTILSYRWENENTLYITEANTQKVPDWTYQAKCLVDTNKESTNPIIKWFNVRVSDNYVIFNKPVKQIIYSLLSLHLDEFELHKLKVSYTNSITNNTAREETKIEIDENDGIKDEVKLIVEKIHEIFRELKRLEEQINEKRPSTVALNNKLKYLEQQVNILLQNSGL